MMNQTISTINLAELLHELGDIDADRIVWDIEPGTATIDDMRDDTFPMCELIDGTIVRKAMGKEESLFATFLSHLMASIIIPNHLGSLTGESALVRLLPKTARAPDIAFTSRLRYPGPERDKQAITPMIPNLAVEVLSESNRAGEMKRKRTIYFNAGVELVWQVDIRKQIIDIYTDAETFTRLTLNDTLDGGTVLPGFSVKLDELFATFDDM